MHTADQIVKSIKRRQRLGFLLMVIAVFVMIIFFLFSLSLNIRYLFPYSKSFFITFQTASSEKYFSISVP